MSRTALADELSLVLRLLAQLQGDAAPPKKGLQPQAGAGSPMLLRSAEALCPPDCAVTRMRLAGLLLHPSARCPAVRVSGAHPMVQPPLPRTQRGCQPGGWGQIPHSPVCTRPQKSVCSVGLRGVLRGAGESFLTPMRLFVWLRAPQLRLRHLAAAAQQVAGLPGGPALGALCAQALHGDPAVHTVRCFYVSTSNVPRPMAFANACLNGCQPAAGALGRQAWHHARAGQAQAGACGRGWVP